MQNSGQPTRLIKINRVIEKVSLSRAQIYKMIAAGEFPCQIKLTERSVAWREDELDSWISDRCSSSRKKNKEFADKLAAAFWRRQQAA
jgi:prophage regulatory protein